ncbi:MAG TPA: hypothetical protein VNK70_01300, partial [Candidatus Paceibacterota bacterium]|nr:hypothetical protein [Candidatus Paceibacterota bacterium]
GFGFISRLKFFGDMKTFVLVGHRPTLEFLIKFLTTQNVEVGNGDVWEVNLNTKTAAKIE